MEDEKDTHHPIVQSPFGLKTVGHHLREPQLHSCLPRAEIYQLTQDIGAAEIASLSHSALSEEMMVTTRSDGREKAGRQG